MRDAGECSEGVKPTVELLRGKGIGAIIACAAEADICITVWTPPPPFLPSVLKTNLRPPAAQALADAQARLHTGTKVHCAVLRQPKRHGLTWTNSA